MIRKWSQGNRLHYAMVKKCLKNGPGETSDHVLSDFRSFPDHFPSNRGGGLRPPPPLGSLFEGKHIKENNLKLLRRLFFESFLNILYGTGPPREYFFSIFGIFFEGPRKITKRIFLEYFLGIPILQSVADLRNIILGYSLKLPY